MPLSDEDKEILFPFADRVIAAYEHELGDYAFNSPAHFIEFKQNLVRALQRGEEVSDLFDYYPMPHVISPPEMLSAV